MANIHPFCAIRPNSVYADQLVFTTMQAESVAGNLNKSGSLPPLKTLLETVARQRPEIAEVQSDAYEEIKNKLQTLLGNQRLWVDAEPGIYVYEIAHKNYRQTGIWALTDLSDYTTGKVKIHELTLDDSVRRLKNYREHTGLEGSPVLLTYPPSLLINRIIAETRDKAKKTSFGNREAFHRLWKIEDKATIKKLVNAFAQIDVVYVADGHHRLKSARMLAQEQEAAGLPVYNTVTSLYMATDQLRMQEYDRVILPLTTLDKHAVLDKIMQNFDAKRIHGNRPVQPKEKGQMGMYLGGTWYNLAPVNPTREKNANGLDVSVLQAQVLAPVFGITDPGTDARLKCIGGDKAIEEIQALLEEQPQAIVFTLCPVSIGQLVKVADAGEILPPKSTWITPKVPYGLLMYRHI